MDVFRKKPKLPFENGHGFAGERGSTVRFAGGHAFCQMQGGKFEPVDCAAAAGESAGCDDAAGIELHILIGVPACADDFADQLALMIPEVEVAAVPIAADDEFGRYRDAADVIGDGEFEFKREGLFVALLDDGGTVGAIFGDGNPDGVTVGGNAAGVETVAFLKFDVAQFAAVFEEEFVEEAFVR